MAMALEDIPVSGCTCFRTCAARAARVGCIVKPGVRGKAGQRRVSGALGRRCGLLTLIM